VRILSARPGLVARFLCLSVGCPCILAFMHTWLTT
jgi:hypothetical protein